MEQNAESLLFLFLGNIVTVDMGIWDATVISRLMWGNLGRCLSCLPKQGF